MENNYIHTGQQAPYYDDWDASKNYKRIVFNPGRAVQARELTQMQTNLQDQLASTTSYLFKNGSPVLGGKISFTIGQPYMVINTVDDDGQPIDVELLIDREFIGRSSGQRIYVVSADPEKRIIYFSYLGGELIDGEKFVSVLTPTRTFSMKVGSLGTAITATCAPGVLFVNGYNISITKQTIIIAIEDINAMYNIGYKVESSFISSSEDASINDNAAGFPNYNAPGADRYKVDAKLFSFKGNEIPEGIEFVSGIVIQNQKLIKEQKNASDGSALMDVLAKRTYDESGSYTVEAWKAIIKEHPDDLSKFIVSMQEGLGYINGYEVRTIVSTDIPVNKARKSVSKNDVNVYNTNGLYTYGLYENNVLSASIFPNFIQHDTVEVMTGINGTGTVLGTCRIINMRRQNTKILIYLTDAGDIVSAFSGARSLRSKAMPNNYINLYIDEANCAVLFGQETPDIIKTGLNMVKSIEADNINYEVTKRYVSTSESAGNMLIISDNDSHIDFLYAESIVAIYDSNGNQVNLNTLNILPNNSSGVSTCTISGTSIVNSTEYIVYARVRAEFMSNRVKIIKNNIETVSIAPNISELTLAKEDIFDIVSIVQQDNLTITDPEELKSYVTLDTGQTDHYYDYGKITNLNSSVLQSKRLDKEIATTYKIEYRYFEHDGSGPFTVNSYATSGNIAETPDIDDIYIRIPEYKSSYGTYSLRDCLDFRIKRSELKNMNVTYPVSETELSFNSEIYLPRIDNIYVDKNGKFGVQEGIPSNEPKVPLSTSDSLVLYTMEVPAYVTDVKQIKLNYIDNQRYTMADISDLDTRLTNLEDAVSITQLENNAMDMKITDETGLDKFKTGIFTDNFTNFDKSDYTNKDWDANFDSVDNALRSNFECENYKFNYIEEKSINANKDAITISLPYTTEVYVQNDFASETVNVQEFLFYTWKGSLKLTPSVDNWVNDLGQIVVAETWSGATVAPPTQYRTWSTTRYTGRSGWNLRRNTTTTTQVTTYRQEISLQQSKVNMTSQDEFMRVREVQYECDGFRPGMKINAFMDNVELELSNDIVNSDGKLSGTFMVPEKMPVGTKNVLFADTANTSSAEATYTASGTTVWTEVTNNYIRNYVPVTTSSSRTSSVYLDPVAQSFYVEEKSGVYVDSIDVFFKSKDEELTVYAYIVECENGYPTNRKVPFSEKHLKPSEVNLSDDATVPTKFKFDEPVFLPGDAEYAFVIATPSYKYRLFISRLGQPNIYDGIGIYEQPYLGSMFLSQNASTWTADQQADITFKIYIRKYDISETAIAVFELEQPDKDFEVVYSLLSVNGFNTSNTSIGYEYKWYNDTSWTAFNNKEDIFYEELKLIRKYTLEQQTSLSIRATMSTKNEFVTPQIDLEQVFGIFTHNTIHEPKEEDLKLDVLNPDGSNYQYITGTYVSQPVNLKYSSSDLRVMIDALIPKNTNVDVYFKTSAFKPLFVQQSASGTIGTDTSTNEELVGKILTLYYYNSETKQLEPQIDCQMSGYSGRTIYLNSVSDTSKFVPIITGATADDSRYKDINIKYTHLLLLPFTSYTNIDITDWKNSETYIVGDYVFYNGYVWTALRDVAANQIPSDFSISWQKIPCIKTISAITFGDTLEWQPMKKDESLIISQGANSGNNYIEYTYYPALDIGSEFGSFVIKIVMRSQNRIDAPQIKNLRAIATI